MENNPIRFALYERTATLGKMKGKTVIQAKPTGRERISHRNFCEEVGRATTFTGAEVEAVLRLASEVAKKHVENGDSVDFGDIGTLRPTFKSKQIEKGTEEFNAHKHIIKPRVLLSPSRQYFELRGVSFERVEPQPKKKAKGSEVTQDILDSAKKEGDDDKDYTGL